MLPFLCLGYKRLQLEKRMRAFYTSGDLTKHFKRIRQQLPAESAKSCCRTRLISSSPTCLRCFRIKCLFPKPRIQILGLGVAAFSCLLGFCTLFCLEQICLSVQDSNLPRPWNAQRRHLLRHPAIHTLPPVTSPP